VVFGDHAAIALSLVLGRIEIEDDRRRSWCRLATRARHDGVRVIEAKLPIERILEILGVEMGSLTAR
jgi:hypothetical protein